MKLIKTYISNNIRDSIIYTFFLFFNNGISFILLLLLANFLMPGDYGKLSLFTTFVSLLQIIITLSSSAFVTVAFFHKSLNDLNKIIITIIIIASFVLLLLEGSTFVMPLQIEKLIGFPIWIFSLGGIICYFLVFNNLNLDLWRLEEKPFSYGIYNCSYAIFNFILTLILVEYYRLGWEGRPYALGIVGFIYFIISGLYLIKRRYISWVRPSRKIMKETLYYALPLIPHSVSYWIKQGADRYIINFFYGEDVVGYYSFVMNLASVVVMIGTAFNSSNSVYIFKNLKEGYDRIKNSLLRQEKIMVIIFFCVGIISSTVVSIFIPICFPKYVSSIIYVFPLMIGAVFQCVYLLYVNYIFFYKKTLVLMSISIVTALLQIVISIMLTRYSTIFTAYISMFISLLTAILIYCYSKKLVKQNIYNDI